MLGFFKVIKFISVVIMVGFVSTSTSLASLCGKESDELLRLGEDKYYDAENPSRIADEDKKIREKIYKSMQGKWRGTYTYSYCAGHDNSRIELETAKVESEISERIRSGKVNLKIKSQAEFNDGVTKILEHETIQGIGHATHFELVSDKEIKFIERYRGSRNDGAVLLEKAYTIKMDNKNSSNINILKIHVTGYTNGFFAYDRKWDLARK